MNTLVRWSALAAVLVCGAAHDASAQFPDESYPGSGSMGGAFFKGFTLGENGNAWITANGVDRGLGYEGSYLTFGGLLPLYNDRDGGWWFLESRNHISEEGNYFANLGLGRREYSSVFGAIFGFSFWYDYDGDQAEVFGHDFHQAGVSLEALTESLSVRFNGYLPFGDNDFVIGDPANCFVGHFILLQTGLDSALRGVDGSLGVRLPGTGWLPVMFHVGGYHYKSDTVEEFGGVMARLDLQPADPVDVNLQINHDDQFDTTGLVGVTISLDRLRSRSMASIWQPTQRRDHIVRVNRAPVFATNPDTGLAWRAVHVDNTNPDPGDGTFENPYQSLQLADGTVNVGNSIEDDLILVRRGTGTTFRYNQGITLLDRQQLLGEGVPHFIDTVEVGAYQLCLPANGLRPTITNPAGPAVTLADDNVVSGFIMNGAQQGIVGTAMNNGLIDRNRILNTASHAVNLTDMTGVVGIFENDILDTTGAAADGIRVTQTTGTLLLFGDDNLIERATTGVNLAASGDSTLTALFDRNRGVNENRSDGFRGTVTDDATLNVQIQRTTAISDNADLGIRLLASGNGQLNGDINRNTLERNAGDAGVLAAGIFAEAVGNSNLQLDLSRNVLDGDGVSAQAGFRVHLDVTNMTPNVVTMDRDSILDFGNLGGIAALVEANSRFDFAASGISSSGNRGLGINMQTIETALSRVVISGSDVSNNNLTGINGFTEDTARLIVTVQGSTINDNGSSTFNEGIDLFASDQSVIVAEIANNTIRSNFSQGIETNSLFDSAQIYAFIHDNDIRSNNVGGFVGVTDMLLTIDAGAGAAAEYCLNLTNNLSTSGLDIDNNSATATFNFEDGGGNTGGINQTGTITAVAIGTCDAAVTAGNLRDFP